MLSVVKRVAVIVMNGRREESQFKVGAAVGKAGKSACVGRARAGHELFWWRPSLKPPGPLSSSTRLQNK